MPEYWCTRAGYTPVPDLGYTSVMNRVRLTRPRLQPQPHHSINMTDSGACLRPVWSLIDLLIELVESATSVEDEASSDPAEYEASQAEYEAGSVLVLG